MGILLGSMGDFNNMSYEEMLKKFTKEALIDYIILLDEKLNKNKSKSRDTRSSRKVLLDSFLGK